MRVWACFKTLWACLSFHGSRRNRTSNTNTAAAAPPPVELELRRLYTIQEDFEDSDCPLHSPGDEGERLNRRDGAVCTWVCKFLLVAFDIA